MIRVVVNLLGKFTFYRHAYYIVSWYVREYTSKSDCSIRVDGHYGINLNLRQCNVKLCKLLVITGDSYNVIKLNLNLVVWVIMLFFILFVKQYRFTAQYNM